ncbi:MAG: HAMP domain-containing sensor histidine kinase [Longimicrobiales bacterium]
MNRRVWPAVLAFLALIVFGSYLAYTHYLSKEIRKVAAVQAKVSGLVQQGLTLPDTMLLGSMFDIQGALSGVDIPIVMFNAAAKITIAENIPGHPDLKLGTQYGDSIARHYAARINGRHPENHVVFPGFGEVTFGDPPMLRQLKWIPWLQAAAVVLLMLVLFSIMRSDQRAERERLYAAMARELAHQMGTPLSSLSGWVEVLQLPAHERAGFKTTDDIGDVMRADVERLERVSRRFELIGKPQVLELVAISDVVQELDAYFRPRLPHLGKGGIHLRTSVQPNMPPIRANRVLLVWALENVIKNAIDALAGRGGRIFVAGHSGGNGEVHLHVIDNGPGVDPKVKDRIFNAGVSTKSSGWGVGLSLTRRIVEELHHGKIAARNRRSRGTAFDIVLPTAEATHSKSKA